MNDLRDDTAGHTHAPSPYLAQLAANSMENSAGIIPSATNGDNSFPHDSSVVFTGTGMEMFKIYAVNILLTIITFGIYYVWGKTRLRRYIWGKSLVFHEPLEYTGTGWEIFRSLLIVGSLFFVVNIGITLAAAGNLTISIIASLIWLAVIMLLTPYSLYCAMRFRFSRTYWRGIRGRMGGSALRFGVKGVLLGLLLVVSLGFAYPFVYQKLAAYAVSQARFGSASFRLENKAGALAKHFIPCWIGSIAMLIPGLVTQNEFVLIVCMLLISVLWLVFPAIQLNWLLGGIRLSDEHNELRLSATVPLVGFLVLNVTNILATVLTLGLAWPWARARRLRYIASYLTIRGNLDWASISQSPEAPVEYGEGLFSVLDLDLGF